jgi:hypothetical protein
MTGMGSLNCLRLVLTGPQQLVVHPGVSSSVSESSTTWISLSLEDVDADFAFFFFFCFFFF